MTSNFERMASRSKLPEKSEALQGREDMMVIREDHAVFLTPITQKCAANQQKIILGLGCFWGAERLFWQVHGVKMTAVGYSGGMTPNPTYEEVCSGKTGHNEVVLVIYDPDTVSFTELLALYWQSHDPTQGMRQGNDIGTQYRSGIYCFSEEQIEAAQASKQAYSNALSKEGYSEITTEITMAEPLYLAEDYHQQYLAKNPNGYCGLGGTGVACSFGA